MSTKIDRQIMTQIIIIVAACVGGWMVVVDPKLSEINKLETEKARAAQNTTLADRTQIERLAKRLQKVRLRVNEIDQRNRFGRDPSQMYGLVLDLADQHGVVVRRLVADSGTGASKDDTVDQVTTFHMMAEGTYQQVAVFLNAVDKLKGFVRPVSLAIRPIRNGERAHVSGEYSWEALSFKMPKVLTTMMEKPRDNG